ncbi:MAG: Sec-independent protein translocase protein TatB [Azonexus sp.]
MFDIGFSELVVIGIVALVVIGPERLPKVARTVGHLLGRAQRYVNDVKADINREMQLDELRKLQAQVNESARSLETSMRQEIGSLQESIETPLQEATASLRSLGEEPGATASAPENTAALASPGKDTPAA